jgi:hypothetical protein
MTIPIWKKLLDEKIEKEKPSGKSIALEACDHAKNMWDRVYLLYCYGECSLEEVITAMQHVIDCDKNYVYEESKAF